jgi:hypothetical protein
MEGSNRNVDQHPAIATAFRHILAAVAAAIAWTTTWPSASASTMWSSGAVQGGSASNARARDMWEGSMAWPPRLAAARQSDEVRLLSSPLSWRPPSSPRSRLLLAVAAALLVWPNAVVPAMDALGMDAGEFVFVGESE